MKILRYLDLLWFIGESFHRKEKAPGDGNSLILWCWYLDVLLPMLTLMHCWLPEGDILRDRCSRPAACSLDLLPFQIYGKAPERNICRLS